ncbi:MAG: hypothetical protein IJR89_07100 [Clostridia bacterium]|nr:hypothetical protein [Clostridia bacterium]
MYDGEFHVPAADTENPVPVELEDPREEKIPRETQPAVEEAVPQDEYHELPQPETPEDESDRSAKSDRLRHSRVKEFFLKPVIAAVTVASVVLASTGEDLLGHDFLSSDYDEWRHHHGSYYDDNRGGEDDPYLPYTPQGNELWSQTDDIVVVTYRPTGETYQPESLNEEALADARRWVEEKGGDSSQLRFLYSESHYEILFTEDAIVIGDPDAPDSLYLAQGSQYAKGVRTSYYEACAKGETVFDPAKESGAESFPPSRSNPFPDFDGEYAWGDLGSEEYIRFLSADKTEYTYLVLGEAWEKMGGKLGSLPGASYDENTNRLTLKNFTGSILDVNLMGNAFSIELIGENRLDQLLIWGAGHSGSVWLQGSGSLILNENHTAPGDVGLRMQAEGGAALLLVDPSVTLDVSGSPALFISDSRSEVGIEYLRGETKMTGGVRAVLESKNAADHELSPYGDVTYYTHSVVDTNGVPSTRVRFEPVS